MVTHNKWKVTLWRRGFGAGASATGYSKFSAFRRAMSSNPLYVEGGMPLYVLGGKVREGVMIRPDLTRAFRECFQRALEHFPKGRHVPFVISPPDEETGAYVTVQQLVSRRKEATNAEAIAQVAEDAQRVPVEAC